MRSAEELRTLCDQLTVEEVALLLGVKPGTVRHKVWDRSFPGGALHGRRMLWDAGAVRAWLAQHAANKARRPLRRRRRRISTP